MSNTMSEDFFNAADDGQAQDNASRPPPGQHRTKIVKTIQQLGFRHDPWRVFSDFVELSALTISNAVDRPQYDVREARYMDIIGRYSKEESFLFAEMFADLVMELEAAPDDVLGLVFHELELHNKYKGQYFTPMPLARSLAKLTIGDAEHLNALIADRGYVRAAEDACGSAVMMIALAEEMQALGVNYQQCLHVRATDVDPKCAHMAYVQLSLLHVPAVVVHGNSLSLEEFSQWFTPAHIMGGWGFRLQRERSSTPGANVSPTSGPAVQDVPEPPRSGGAGPQLTLF